MSEPPSYTKLCPNCGKPMPKQRGVCPECGGMTSWFKVRMALGCVAVGIFVLGLVSMVLAALFLG